MRKCAKRNQKKVDSSGSESDSCEEYVEGGCARKLRAIYRQDRSMQDKYFEAIKFYDPECKCQDCREKMAHQQWKIAKVQADPKRRKRDVDGGSREGTPDIDAEMEAALASLEEEKKKADEMVRRSQQGTTTIQENDRADEVVRRSHEGTTTILTMSKAPGGSDAGWRSREGTPKVLQMKDLHGEADPARWSREGTPARGSEDPLPYYYQQQPAHVKQGTASSSSLKPPTAAAVVSTSSVAPDPAKKFIIRPEMVSDVLMRLHAGQPAVDAFNEGRAKVCDKHWGRTAWAENWSFDEAGLIWANPPVKELADIIRAVRRSKAQMILIVPEWAEQCNNQSMWNMTRKCYYYKPDSQLYKKKRDKQDNEYPKQWGTWALYLDGAQTESSYKSGEVAKVLKTKTADRNRRRKGRRPS